MDVLLRPGPRQGRWPRRTADPLRILFLVVLVAAGLTAWAIRSFGSGPAAAPAAPPVAPGAFRPTDEQWKALTFAAVRPAAFPEEEETEGQIATADDVTVPVFPPFSGQVDQVFVQAGDRVRKGQPLASVRASELAQAQADLGAAGANLAGARAQLATSEANATRQQALLAAQGAAVRDVQQATSDLASARAAVVSDETAVTAVKNRLRILGYDDAQIDAMANHPAGDTGAVAMVRAPIAGTVVQRQVGPGQYLNSTANGATTPLFTVSDVSKVWLVANVREEDAGRVKVGDPVRVRVVALPGRTFDAKLSYVAPAIDPGTRRLPVRAVLPSPGGLLKPGMFADFSIVSATGETSPAVPVSAVVYDGAQARVWVVQPDRSLALRPIVAGRTRDGLVEALQGVTPGEQVVTAGALFIDRAAKSD